MGERGITYALHRSRRRQKEISLEYRTEEMFYPLGTTDKYFEAPYKENASLAAAGEPPKLTKFETDKERLRSVIRTALSSAVSFEDFSGKLLQQGVTVKEPGEIELSHAGQDEADHRPEIR